jgi:CRISPR-associated protein Csb3
MMGQVQEPTIRVRVDPTNPGQFFACCGLLELADRLWSGAEGWFEGHGTHFCVRTVKTTPPPVASTLIAAFTQCRLTNVMTGFQFQRRDELSTMPKGQRKGRPALESEKKLLDSLWREAPILLEKPFNLRLDWFVDDHAGGDTFKTWAGQQSVLEIARGMKAPIDMGNLGQTAPEEWLSLTANSESLPFNFDSDLGGVGSDRDVGFSFDPLKSIRVRTRPLVEILAFVGLQRFRPSETTIRDLYRFSLWSDPLVPEVAAIAACGLLESPDSRTFGFRLLYRTKYLKSFLPAHQLGG